MGWAVNRRAEVSLQFERHSGHMILDLLYVFLTPLCNVTCFETLFKLVKTPTQNYFKQKKKMRTDSEKSRHLLFSVSATKTTKATVSRWVFIPWCFSQFVELEPQTLLCFLGFQVMDQLCTFTEWLQIMCCHHFPILSWEYQLNFGSVFTLTEPSLTYKKALIQTTLLYHWLSIGV